MTRTRISNTRAWCHEPDRQRRMVSPNITYLLVCLSLGISLMHLRGGLAIFSSQLSAHPRDKKIEKKFQVVQPCHRTGARTVVTGEGVPEVSRPRLAVGRDIGECMPRKPETGTHPDGAPGPREREPPENRGCRTGIGCRSVAVGRDHLTTRFRAQGPPNAHGDRILDEPDTAVRHHHVDTAWVHAGGVLVLTVFEPATPTIEPASAPRV